jgi:hypothetical protein
VQDAFALPGVAVKHDARSRHASLPRKPRAAAATGTAGALSHTRARSPGIGKPPLQPEAVAGALPSVRAGRSGSAPPAPPSLLLTAPGVNDGGAAAAPVATGASRGATPSAVAAEAEAELVKRIKTSDQVVEFYAQYGQDSSITFFVCVQADAGLLHRPYDLRVVKREDAGSDYYTISATGVMHMRRGARAGVRRPICAGCAYFPVMVLAAVAACQHGARHAGSSLSRAALLAVCYVNRSGLHPNTR